MFDSPSTGDLALGEVNHAKRKNRELQERVDLLEKQVAALHSFIDRKFDVIWRDADIWRGK